MSNIKEYAKKIKKARSKSNWEEIKVLVNEALEKPDIKQSRLAKELGIAVTTLGIWKIGGHPARKPWNPKDKKKKEEEKDQAAEFKGKFKAKEVQQIGEGEAEEVAKVRIMTQATASLIDEATDEVMGQREEDVAFAMRLRREFKYLRAKVEQDDDLNWEDYVVAAVDHYENSDEILKDLDYLKEKNPLLEKQVKLLEAKLLEYKTRLHEHRELIAMSMNLQVNNIPEGA